MKKLLANSKGPNPLPDGPYDAQATEPRILKDWLEKQLYKPETARKLLYKQGRADRLTDHEQRFTLINPPPNAYARPHMGNISGYAYQDVFARRARMQGQVALMIPGKDHAAQQAEIIYTRDVLGPLGKDRDDFNREDFYNQAYEYFTGIASEAQQDEKRIGLSSDFDRDLFTLDPRIASSVYRTFAQLWRDRMVYKGVRIVNWSPGLQSAVADIDTERQTVKSTMHYLKYALPQVDQDVLAAREDFKTGIHEAEVVEITKLEKPELKKLAKKSGAILTKLRLPERDNAELTCWLLSSNISKGLSKDSPKIHTGDLPENLVAGTTLSLNFIGLVIPLTGEVELIGTIQPEQSETTVESSDQIGDPEVKITTELDEPNLSKEAEEFIFKAANARQGSAFIRLFEEDDSTPHNDYARGFIVGTVRPETMFGDTAIVVHPEDDRFSELVGQNLDFVGLNGPVKLRIIADNSIDREFGTGAMKLTPAHAPGDYEIYLRHNNSVAAQSSSSGENDNSDETQKIGYLNVIGKDSRLNELAGKASGLHAEEEREQVVTLLQNAGLIVFSEPAESNITICERTKTTIQPMMSSQWFVDTDALKQPALEAVRAGKVTIHPDYMTKKLESWLENLRDWPISRSIWWGYRIPVWYRGELREYTDTHGQVAVEIGGTKVESMEQAIADGLMKLDLGEGFAPILVPGRHGLAAHTGFAKLKEQYPWAQIVDLPNRENPGGKDYAKALSQLDLDENSVIVTHSRGNAGVLDYLVESKIKIKALIMIASANHLSKIKVQHEELGFWQKLPDYSQLADQIKQISVIYSDDDEYYSRENFEEFIDKHLPKGTAAYLEQGKKHFYGINYNHGSENLEQILASLASDFIAEQKTPEEQGFTHQDEDVFDTWFSSGQWPYATLEATGLMEHYPTQVMETGFDILELWVSRMLMLGIYTQGRVPFEDVYLHGLIKAEDGQKMSKSKGNIVYAQEIIDEHGADTLRLFYIVGNRAGSSYRVDRRKIKGYRNFLNKLWNASRFVISNMAEEVEGVEGIEGGNQNPQEEVSAKFQSVASDYESTVNTQTDLAEYRQVAKAELVKKLGDDPDQIDKMMLVSLKNLVESVNYHYDNFRPGLAAEEIIQHCWHVFADIYIEQVKGRLFLKDRDGNEINRSEAEQDSRNQALAHLQFALQTYLKLLHPLTPFITEEIWQHLPEESRESESIMYSVWPQA